MITSLNKDTLYVLRDVLSDVLSGKGNQALQTQTYRDEVKRAVETFDIAIRNMDTNKDPCYSPSEDDEGYWEWTM